MKKFIVFLMSALALSVFAFAANNSPVEEPVCNESQSQTPQVCKFSIDAPTGTIQANCCTLPFCVLLSCPQDSDVNVTVSVVIDGDVVGNKIVRVPKGTTSSASTVVNVGSDYIGKRYKLTVE